MTNPETLEKNTLQMPTIDPGVRIGHVHLKVADLQRALDFLLQGAGFYTHHEPSGRSFHLCRRLSPSSGLEHLGEPRWLATRSRHNRPLSYCHSLPEPGAPRGRAAPADRRQDSAGRGQ